MRKEFEENEESENKSENNLETQDEIDDETFQKILEKEFIEREKRITAALFADDDVEDIKFTKEELDNSYQEFLRRIEREKKENTEFSEELVPDVDAIRRKETASDEKRVISIEEIRDRRKKTAEREMREEVSKEANTEKPNAKNRTNTENRMNTKIRTTGGGLHRLGKVVGMAVVCVACVFAASMTSEANRKYLVNSVRVWSGDDTKTVVDNDESNEKSNVDEDEETTEDFAEDTSYSLLRGTNLNLGTLKIQKITSNEVAIYGLTQCHKTCSKVYLSIYLERKVNGSYGTYKYWNFTANNVSHLEKELDVAVPSGTYYRVRGYHAASNGGLKESTSTLTSGIMVK